MESIEKDDGRIAQLVEGAELLLPKSILAYFQKNRLASLWMDLAAKLEVLVKLC